MPLKRLTALYLGCCHQLTDGAARHIVRGLKVSIGVLDTPFDHNHKLRPPSQDPHASLSLDVFKWSWPRHIAA
jgi:hypothetical protein